MAISDENDRLTIIISKKMKNELKQLAELENRSLSNYVVNVLEQHLDSLTQLSLNFENEIQSENQYNRGFQRTQLKQTNKRANSDDNSLGIITSHAQSGKSQSLFRLNRFGYDEVAASIEDFNIVAKDGNSDTFESNSDLKEGKPLNFNLKNE
ncbi:hypothetical protein [Cytobacillus praedii]|uniref:hypothetical protein n=1 Tax=Cytobacillus praedii TaxID=1742358 RepID=UPI001A9A2477|nr:hypothetical protein [Cytobacillus praedii]